MLTWLDPLVAQLLRFIRYTVLPAVPRALWWVLLAMMVASLNLVFEREVWPNTPKAEPVFTGGLCTALATLPWFAADTARRISQKVASWWCGMWWLVALGCYLVAAASTFIFCIVVVSMCWKMVALIFH